MSKHTTRKTADAVDSDVEESVDTSDIPEQLNWDDAERGRFYRPVKKAVSLRLDADVLAWFQASGKGYQTRINQVLREYIQHRG